MTKCAYITTESNTLSNEEKGVARTLDTVFVIFNEEKNTAFFKYFSEDAVIDSLWAQRKIPKKEWEKTILISLRFIKALTFTNVVIKISGSRATASGIIKNEDMRGRHHANFCIFFLSREDDEWLITETKYE